MKDRVAAAGRTGRVKITGGNVTGTVDADGALIITGISGVFEFDDDATTPGSAYSKNNVLPASLTAALNLPDDTAEPADAFLALHNRTAALETELLNVSDLIGGE